MAGKHKRAGGKFTGSHTTLIPAAALVADIASASPHVAKLSPGFIKAGLRPARGQRRLKIADEGSQLLLSVRDNTSQQTLHVYARDKAKAISAIVEGASQAGLLVSVAV